MDEYFADKLTEIQDTEDTAYLLENNEIFYDVGYKVMQNQENANLLRCHRIKYNGKIKLIYFTREYTSLEDYIASSDMDTILNAIRSLLEALIQIENLGFLNMACIDNRLSHIYVESGTNNVKIIYLPVNITGVHKNKNEFKLNLKKKKIKMLNEKDNYGLFLNNNKLEKEKVDNLVKNQKVFNNEINNNYVVEDNYLYKVLNNYKIKVSNQQITSIIRIIDNDVYYLVGDTLYRYTNNNGEEKLLKHKEWKYNYKNQIFIFNK